MKWHGKRVQSVVLTASEIEARKSATERRAAHREEQQRKSREEAERRRTSGKPVRKRRKHPWEGKACKSRTRKSRHSRHVDTSGRTYESRQFHLLGLGFADYAEYLASDLWAGIRQRVFAEKGRRCVLCREPATQLHHNRYHECDLSGRVLKHVHPICRECHVSIEFADDGTKRILEHVFAEFLRLLNAARLTP